MAKSEAKTTIPQPDEEKSIVELMEENRRKRFRDAVMKWRGKLHLTVNVDELRGRNRQ